MSVLAEVLTSAEKLEFEDVNTKLPKLKQSIENHKSELIHYIETVYVSYSSQPQQNKALLKESLELEKELCVLKENAEGLIKKEFPEEHDKLLNNIVELNNIEFTLQIVVHLQHCLKSLNSFTTNLEAKNYLKCMEIRKEIENLMNQLSVEENLDIMQDFTISVENEYFSLLNILKNLFSENVQLCESAETNSFFIKIKKYNEEFKQALLAMYFDTEDIYPLHAVIKSLWNSVFTPIVDYLTDIEISENKDFMSLKLTVFKDKKKKPDYLKVFKSLEILLSFFAKHLDYELADNLTILEYIGSSVRDNLSELIIKHCLQDTIPSNAEDLEGYKEVIENTRLFETYLHKIKIFTGETASLIEYANNIDIHFINKKCQEYLATAEDLMKRDLHDIIELGEPYCPDSPLSSVSNFSQCFVSKSAVELIDLTKTILIKALSASDLCAGRMIYTLQNIFIKYCNFVPLAHKNLLQTIPQQVALFHNNCLYMSYTLLKWDLEYGDKLTHIISYCSFDDQAIKLRNIAADFFSNYVEGQINQLKEIMKEAALNGATIEKLEPSTEKCIRQCLRQQELLKTVWHKVLSYTVYNKTMGTIFNAFCTIIINSIVMFEDISADAAQQTVELFKLILTRGPKLFLDPREVSMYVDSWHKLNELNFVLSASLLDINDRWADGKGPLALQFTPKQLKQLIRALFQNTDRRALVLSKIQDN